MKTEGPEKHAKTNTKGFSSGFRFRSFPELKTPWARSRSPPRGTPTCTSGSLSVERATGAGSSRSSGGRRGGGGWRGGASSSSSSSSSARPGRAGCFPLGCCSVDAASAAAAAAAADPASEAARRRRPRRRCACAGPRAQGSSPFLRRRPLGLFHPRHQPRQQRPFSQRRRRGGPPSRKKGGF